MDIAAREQLIDTLQEMYVKLMQEGLTKNLETYIERAWKHLEAAYKDEPERESDDQWIAVTEALDALEQDIYDDQMAAEETLEDILDILHDERDAVVGMDVDEEL